MFVGQFYSVAGRARLCLFLRTVRAGGLRVFSVCKRSSAEKTAAWVGASAFRGAVAVGARPVAGGGLWGAGVRHELFCALIHVACRMAVGASGRLGRGAPTVRRQVEVATVALGAGGVGVLLLWRRGRAGSSADKV